MNVLRTAILVVAVSLGLAAQSPPRIDNLGSRETRSADSYRMETSYDDGVCADILQKLNKTYWMPTSPTTPYDYTEVEAHYYLGTHESVRWAKKDIRLTTPVPAELAEIDIFNSGRPSTILRRVTSVSSTQHYRLYLGALQDGRWSLTEVPFDYSRERNRRVGPELSSAFSFPLLDVITSSGRNYILLKPVSGLAREARVYLLRLHGINDYELVCTVVMR